MIPALGTPPVGDERGFTLVELLVALAGSTVVVFAAFSIIVVALHQSTRVADRVQADQTGRTAMEIITEKLHSSCLAKKFAPVKEKSSPTELRFVSAASNSAQISSSKANPEAFEDRIVWQEVKNKEGTLTDERYPVEGGTEPSKYVFAKTPSSKILLATNVSERTKGGNAVPLFKYYEYAKQTEAGSEETGVEALTPLASQEKPLETEQAAKVAAVEVNFKVVGREENEAQQKQAAYFNDEVILAFGLPSSEATVTDTPCQ